MKTICVLFLVFLVSATAVAQEGVLIAAASDVKFALDSVIAVFQQTHAVKIRTVYGSSGKLTEQITHGAPFDIFLSADIEYPKKLMSTGKTSSDIFAYARGRLVMWSLSPAAGETLDVLLDPAIKKIAIANPAHAPYGKRAIEALQYEGMYPMLKPKLVLGDNVSQAAQFVLSGAADVGIIALSLALSPNMKDAGTYFLIPENYHTPLIQGAVIIKRTSAAETFFQFLGNNSSAAIFEYFGFSKP